MVHARVLYRADPDLAAGTARRAAQIAAEHGLTPWRVSALFYLGSLQFSAGDTTAVVLEQARVLAESSGALVHAVQARMLQSDATLLVHGPADAFPLAVGAAELAGRLRLTGLQAMAELMAAANAALAGEPGGAVRRLLDAAGSRAHAPAEVTALGPLVHALPHLMAHDLARAAALADAGVPRLLRHGSAAPTEWFGLWALLRTAVADRDRDARDTLRAHHSAHAAVNRAALDYADAIAAGRAGRAAEAEARFAAADAALSAMPWWNRLLRSIVLEAAVVDGWGDPVPALRADLAVHESSGETRLARACRDLLRAAGAPTRRSGATPVPPRLRARGVTAREAEVLTLVAAGLTNAQAAQRLFLSPRTVDTHVARLLAKTGAADRRELSGWAGSVDGGTDR